MDKLTFEQTIYRNWATHFGQAADVSGQPGTDADKRETTGGYLAADSLSLHITLTQYRYKPGRAESIQKMAHWAKEGHFDERIFQAFVKSLGIYPIGSFVRLESGRLGVVVEQSEKSLLAPRVKVFFSAKANAYISPELVDLSRPGIRDKIAGGTSTKGVYPPTKAITEEFDRQAH